MNFWKLRARSEMSFFDVLSSFFSIEVIQPFFFRLSEVNSNFFNSSEDDKEICIQIFS